MRVFISYAAEERDLAEQIHLAIVGSGHHTFFDRESLPPAEEYHGRIRAAVEASDVVVFLISATSIEPGSYTLTELKYAKQRWPHPEGRVLPVAVAAVPWEQIPNYLKAVTVLTPEGNKAAEVAQAVQAMQGGLDEPQPAPRTPGSRWMRVVAVAIATTAVAGGATLVPWRKWVGDQPPSMPHVATTPGRPSERSTTALADLQCVLADARDANPILARAAGLVPPTFSVDAARHLLLRADGDPVQIVSAQNLGRLESPRLIVAHFTAAPPGAASSYFASDGATGSAHILIGRDGSPIQLVPFDFAAHHAGPSRWRDLEGLNKFSIGIELDNWGRLERRGNGWVSYTGTGVPDDQVVVLPNREGTSQLGWHRYSDAQLRTFFQIACALRHAYASLEGLVGHDEISDPGRKTDPGPAFPMSFLRRRLFPNQTN